MAIEKISFSGVEQTQTKSEIKKEDIQKETPVEDTEKSKAAKYMIGAAALAGVIAVGIIGHKNNWWRKAQEVGEDIAKKGSDAVQGGERKTAQTAEDAASAGSKADDIQTPKPDSPREKAGSIPGEEPKGKEPEMKKPVEEGAPAEPPKPELKGGDLIKSNLE